MLGQRARDRLADDLPVLGVVAASKSIQGHPATKGDVTIGNDVWIGTNTLVLSGTTIGDGAVIGAGSVVRGRIPPYAIAVGSPCRVVMHRFKPDDISALLAVRWWDWPDDIVAQALPILLSDDVSGIVDFARRHSLVPDEPESALARDLSAAPGRRCARAVTGAPRAMIGACSDSPPCRDLRLAAASRRSIS